MASSPASSSSSSVRNWRRGDLIGSGSFGKVNIAINMETCELFAVKSIECSERAKAELLAMENELQILQDLDSPWIVRCLGSDYTLDNSILMRNLFMEYMAGGSLVDVMKKFGGQLEEPVIRVYTRYILQGLEYLHRQGVVHCDIKGKNILIGAMGAKLADFGSAKRVSKAGVMKGTPLWMAPEVLQQVEQGPPADVWSLGCTIVEMFTGRPPWTNRSNPFSALFQIACTDDLPSLPDCLSAEGKDFLHKCFQRDPQARWTSSQLLEHPFVSKENTSPRYMAPSSPTSILDFPQANGYWDTTPSTELTSVPLLFLQKKTQLNSSPLPCTGARWDDKMSVAQPLSLPIPSEGQWITVRSPNSVAESRQLPLSDFMLQSASEAGGAVGKSEGSGPLSVKKACDVNLDCIAFLRGRRSGVDEGRAISREETGVECVT